MGGRSLLLVGLGVLAAMAVVAGAIWVFLPPGGCDAFFDACKVQAQANHDQCVYRCDQLWTGATASCLADCESELSKETAACSCPAGTECWFDVQHAGGDPQCCPTGQFLCGGVCRQACTQFQHLDHASCSCDCLPHACPADRVLDLKSCGCVCKTTCDPPRTLDERTCECLCPEGQGDCDGTCTPLTGRENCGECGKTCAANEDCCDSSCQRIDIHDRCGSCDNPCLGYNFQCCAGASGGFACTDIGKDPNCGSCGNACGAGKCCFNFACVTPNDVHYCGACSIQCPPKADACCSGECVQRSTDRQNCGRCGVRCSGNEYCNGGTCAPCGTGTAACNDGCFDLSSSATHCGSCANSCAAGQSCCGGQCRPAQSGYGCCGGLWVDLNSPQHCGTCGTTCPSGQQCCGGTCKTSCTTTSPCGAGGQPGQVCCGTTWRTPQQGWSCCGNSWVNLTSDPANCQVCGRICSSGQACQAGQCGTACAAGRFCAAPDVSCPIINLPSYEETTCCPAGNSSCEAALGISVYGRVCCPQGWSCCEAETSSGWAAYCGYQGCDGPQAAPSFGTPTVH